MAVSTTLVPQNLVRDMNSKTHLTNHCLGIRCGKNLPKVVKAAGLKNKSTSHVYIIPMYQTVINHGLKG